MQYQLKDQLNEPWNAKYRQVREFRKEQVKKLRQTLANIEEQKDERKAS